MARPALKRLALYAAGGLSGVFVLLALLVLMLRYVYLLPLELSRPVTFLSGHIVVAVPNTWTVSHEADSPDVFVLRHQKMDATLVLAILAKSGPPGSRAADYLKTRVQGSPIESLDESRAFSVERLEVPDRPWSLNERQHIAQVDRSGHLWHLVAEFVIAPRLEYAPSIRADAAFLRDSLRRATFVPDSEAARKVYDEWAPARVALRDAEADFGAAIEVLLLSGGVFAVTWLLAHWAFEKELRLGKVGYTYLGQATTIVSLVGLMLAAGAIFSNRLDYRTRLAQVTAEMVAGQAALHLHEEATTCPDEMTVSIRRYPLLDNAEMVKYDCKTFRPIVEAMASHFAFARQQVLQQGAFVDPRWSMGLPVTLFIARGRNLVDRAQLPELQSEALWNRYDFFANPLEEALRIIESQSEASALSRLARSAASYWGILVALSLALGMVKLSGDRRIEREKERKDKTKETKDGDEQKNAGDKDQEEGKLGEVMCASTAATADAPQPDSSCDPAVALPAEERGSAAASAPAEADPEIRR